MERPEFDALVGRNLRRLRRMADLTLKELSVIWACTFSSFSATRRGGV